MPQCCPQQLDPNLAPNPAISTHLVVPPLWLSLCQTLCSLQRQLWRLNPDPTPKNVALSINLVSLLDRKSTRLNSSHTVISYAVFCLKKKKEEDRRLGATVGPHVCTRGGWVYDDCKLGDARAWVGSAAHTWLLRLPRASQSGTPTCGYALYNRAWGHIQPDSCATHQALMHLLRPLSRSP